MLTNEDVTKIIEAHKEVFLTKEEAVNLVTKEDFNTLQTSVDKIAKNLDNYHKELQVYQHRTSTLEDWVTQAAPKVGVDYKP